MSNKNVKSKRYCFTIHNYTPKELKQFHKLAGSLEKHRYICYGLEVAPDTDTNHIQGYVELSTAQRLPYVQTYFNIKREGKLHKFHLEIANGTAEENKKYTSKEGKYFEYGEPQTQGARNDLKQIKEAVKQNPRDIHNIVDEHVGNNQQLKYAEGLRQYYFTDRDPKNPPKVFWIYGETGIGKTSLVYRNFEDICSVSSFDWMGTGYNQNECLLLDDLREFSLQFEQLLKLTDRYPFMLFFKGGQIPLNSPYIVITSPKSIEQTFASTRENLQQLKRRLTVLNLNLIIDVENIDLKNLDAKYIDKDVNDISNNF